MKTPVANQKRRAGLPWLVVLALAAGGFSARALTCAFVLKNVTFTCTSVNGQPPIYYPPVSEVMTGQFVWYYNPGDFANGTNRITDLGVPYTGSGVGSLTLVLDNTSLTGTLPGNFHSQGVDFGLTFSPALTSPTQTVSVATSSSFDIWDYSGNERIGTVTAGSIGPYQPPLAWQNTGTNVVFSWPTNYTDAFVLETASSLVASAQWQTSSLPRVVVGQNYTVTNAIGKGTNIFYRLAE